MMWFSITAVRDSGVRFGLVRKGGRVGVAQTRLWQRTVVLIFRRGLRKVSPPGEVEDVLFRGSGRTWNCNPSKAIDLV